MDEVEDMVRTALRDNAAPITQDSLRHPVPPAARRPRTRQALLVAAAFVLAAGGITTAITLSPGDGPHWGAQSLAPAYAGFRWNLRKVDSYEVPADLNASLSFDLDGSFRTYDGVNSMFGHYDATATSARARDVGRTYALYIGADPMRQAVIAAMDELTVVEVETSVTGDQLTVHARSHMMVFTRGGPDTSSAPSR
jgi:heat shock protein HslJ